jgi:hypothetical protein
MPASHTTPWHSGLFQIIICLFTDSAMAEGAVTIGDPIEKPQLKHAQRLCIHNNPRSTRSPQNGSNSSTWQDITAKVSPRLARNKGNKANSQARWTEMTINKKKGNREKTTKSRAWRDSRGNLAQTPERGFHQSAFSVYKVPSCQDLCNAITITSPCMVVVQFALR